MVWYCLPVNGSARDTKPHKVLSEPKSVQDLMSRHPYPALACLLAAARQEACETMYPSPNILVGRFPENKAVVVLIAERQE